MSGLADKRFLVCGGSRGLGRAVAELLLERGARPHIVSRTPESHGLRGASATAADLSSTAGLAAVVDWVRANGPLDGVLVNAGGPPAGTALGLGDDEWQFAFELLVLGPIRLLRAIDEHLSTPSSVVFITSSSVRQPIAGLDSSNVLRPAVAALANTLSLQLAPRTRVNTIAPGRFDTDRVAQLDRDRAQAAGIPLDEQRARAARSIPLGRYGDPLELARAAVFLLSDDASYITGAALQVDGGIVTSVP